MYNVLTVIQERMPQEDVRQYGFPHLFGTAWTNALQLLLYPSELRKELQLSNNTSTSMHTRLLKFYTFLLDNSNAKIQMMQTQIPKYIAHDPNHEKTTPHFRYNATAPFPLALRFITGPPNCTPPPCDAKFLDRAPVTSTSISVLSSGWLPIGCCASAEESPAAP